ncbi:hypothetical protein ACFVIY_28885 [Streptomyces sp. NPDC127166]|uniref:hypothetical protein n=1 Tax=Streptomyces sp. NPDC127166 TaxID=3345380 RepID=UPI0036330EEF
MRTKACSTRPLICRCSVPPVACRLPPAACLLAGQQGSSGAFVVRGGKAGVDVGALGRHDHAFAALGQAGVPPGPYVEIGRAAAVADLVSASVMVARGRSDSRSRTGTRTPSAVHSRSSAASGREADPDRQQRPRRLNAPADRRRRAAEQRRELPHREVRPRVQRVASERHLELVAPVDPEVIEDDAFRRLMDPA